MGSGTNAAFPCVHWTENSLMKPVAEFLDTLLETLGGECHSARHSRLKARCREAECLE